ncbi:amino acid/amide ABC transporter membrane protein 1, HAAT family [Chitinophaga jiangningensis]|uniref:Amino acid/amide ABC transporter membrane protein 1, HAAT family n=1 Tax=Chitinophaga jiangningensis TaxID=1419482 RepID=A0A1M7CKE4_9BACT|nr:urea ABC transporter permease subunit UrtB [Chitinophaga jiangningensis]SHL67685.1 amino acid/amide ABC transporter membrane protein 1, HAAT family [Chitinophaga jiangningensis]
MKNSLKFGWILLLLLVAMASRAQDSSSLYVAQLLHPQSDSVRTHAIGRLVALRIPATFPLLMAINDKKLYLLDNQAITIDGKPSDEEKYRLHRVYPDTRPLHNSSGDPLLLSLSQLKTVDIPRADRLLLLPIAPLFNLYSPDAQKRIQAYGQLTDLQDPQVQKILADVVSKETDYNALRIGKESLYAIQLHTAKNEATAKAYIDSIARNWSDNASALLTAYGSGKAFNTNTANYAIEKAKQLESKYDNLQRIQNLFSGLSLGSILILIALGLSIVYGLAGVINMAHGEFMMIGAYTTYCIQMLFSRGYGDWFFIISLPLSFIVAGLMGLILERLVIRHLYSKPLESLLATWGISLILVQTARLIFGDLTAVKTPQLLAGGWQAAPHLTLPYNRIFIIALTAVMVLLTYLMLFKTKLGLQIRAVTQNRQMSACLGVETRRIAAVTFFIGSGLAGLAGCAITLIGNVVPDMGQTYIVDSFLVVVTGGVGKLAGTIVSGLGIGFFTKISEAFFQAVYGKVFILLFIMLFMQYKPKGLFPDKGRIAEE